MTPAQRATLHLLARDNATLHSLVQLYEHGSIPFDKWWETAIVLLTVQNKMLLKELADAHARRPLPSILSPRPLAPLEG